MSRRQEHGHTTAAWVTVSLIMLASVGCLIALIMGSAWGFWASAALVPIAIGVGRILSGMGFGAMPGWESEQPEDADPTTGGADL